MHIQAIMLRIEMELANDPENLCVIFFDPGISGEIIERNLL